jgi:hypothetical protein
MIAVWQVSVPAFYFPVKELQDEYSVFLEHLPVAQPGKEVISVVLITASTKSYHWRVL